MSIADFIRKQKEQHQRNITFKKENAEKRLRNDLQYEQREVTEQLAVERQRAALREQKKELRELRSQPARDRLSAIKSGFENFKKNVEKNTTKKETGINSLAGSGPNPFRPTSNPFGPDNVKKVSPNKGKTITIKLKE